MKKITFSIVVAGLLLLAGAFSYSSCNKDETASAADPATQPMVTKAGGTVLGYLDESNAFKPISNDRLLDFYRNILHLSADMALGEPQIVTEGSTQPSVKVRSVDGTLRISTRLTAYGGGGMYIMNGGGGSVTCTCTTVDCSSSSGCDSKLDGGSCTCTPCANGGECKKSSTTTSNMALRAFFGA